MHTWRSCRYWTCVTLLVCGQISAETVEFTQDIYPLLERHCFKCHGESKQSGELALHLPSAIEDFGVVTPHEPDDSSLLERLTLEEDDELRMPKGSAPLSADEIALFRQWIAEGAAMPEDEAITKLQHQAVNLPDAQPAETDAIDAVRNTGAAVIELYSGSPLLQVSFAHTSASIGDDQLQPLAGIAPQIVSLNLSRTQVTDNGLAILAKLTNLMRLHLEQTAVTDDGLKHLAGLPYLEYLNLYGTSIGDEGLEHLRELNALRRLYLWQTSVSYEAAMDLQKSIPGLEVNLGWDHPDVVKAREARQAQLEAERKVDEPAEPTAAPDAEPDNPQP